MRSHCKTMTRAVIKRVERWWSELRGCRLSYFKNIVLHAVDELETDLTIQLELLNSNNRKGFPSRVVLTG